MIDRYVTDYFARQIRQALSTETDVSDFVNADLVLIYSNSNDGVTIEIGKTKFDANIRMDSFLVSKTITKYWGSITSQEKFVSLYNVVSEEEQSYSNAYNYVVNVVGALEEFFGIDDKIYRFSELSTHSDNFTIEGTSKDGIKWYFTLDELFSIDVYFGVTTYIVAQLERMKYE